MIRRLCVYCYTTVGNETKLIFVYFKLLKSWWLKNWLFWVTSIRTRYKVTYKIFYFVRRITDGRSYADSSWFQFHRRYLLYDYDHLTEICCHIKLKYALLCSTETRNCLWYTYGMSSVKKKKSLVWFWPVSTLQHQLNEPCKDLPWVVPQIRRLVANFSPWRPGLNPE